MQKILALLLYLRGVLHWLWVVFLTTGTGVVVISLEWMGARHIVGKVSRVWAFGFLRFCGIQVVTKNAHHLPKNQSFLMVFNHNSYLDILVLMQSSPRRLHFGAKKSLFFVPILGFIMKTLGHFAIDRKKPRNTYNTYHSLAGRIQKGDVFVLSPEGGRNKMDPNTLSHFHKGPFLFAHLHKLPIVPVIIKGAGECMPTGARFFNTTAWKYKIVVEYLSPLKIEIMKQNEISKMRDIVYQTMLHALSS